MCVSAKMRAKAQTRAQQERKERTAAQNSSQMRAKAQTNAQQAHSSTQHALKRAQQRTHVNKSAQTRAPPPPTTHKFQIKCQRVEQHNTTS